ncbi:F0F1 ATP synthase subunit epsilon [Nocardia brasiliensis]|uniref:ATP synthase epsilon chain n=1 Tax=Nocardia brasiliensis (strain ATCC 700358 / HUJEG-1) TaxID=1133849 RepID=K0EN57_NOCB7|nr:ATP synthase F0F1 subunit epsilon [Nocardia brasiliensis]AFU01063.1 ATP synthase F0F1 subunit epsilon [Nocardia brasiliensis ATCC 700358]OCF84269.1 hypothetical protein AW168_04100 [Nocardia brasiliensis]
MQRSSGRDPRLRTARGLAVVLEVPGYREFVFSADRVRVPTVDGVQVLEPGHDRMDVALDIGVLTVRAGAREWLAALHGGELRAVDDEIRLTAQGLEFAERIDVVRARTAQTDAAQRLTDDRSDDAARAALQRANVRLAVAARVHC